MTRHFYPFMIFLLQNKFQTKVIFYEFKENLLEKKI